MLNAKKISVSSNSTGSKQDPIPVGSYPCRVVQVLDLGVQPQRPYQGQDKPPAHEVMLTYEFTDEFCLDENGEEQEDKPRWLSETFPLRSLESDLAKSTKRYNAIDPDDTCDGDFTQLVGMPANVAVSHRDAGDKTYVNVAGVSTVRPKDAKRMPQLVNDPKVFALEEPDLDVFLSLPEWIQEKIKGNLNYQGSELQGLLEEEKPKKKEKAPTKPAPSEDAGDEEDEEWMD